MAQKVNIIIDQGATYVTTIDITDDDGTAIDITNYIASAQIRKHYSSTNFIQFTTAVDGVNGAVILSLTSNQTANITSGRYVYDCELTAPDGVISRIIEGIVTITPSVTR